jgi:hypothetical protein
MGEFNPEEEQLLAEKAIPLEWKSKYHPASEIPTVRLFLEKAADD